MSVAHPGMSSRDDMNNQRSCLQPPSSNHWHPDPTPNVTQRLARILSQKVHVKGVWQDQRNLRVNVDGHTSKEALCQRIFGILTFNEETLRGQLPSNAIVLPEVVPDHMLREWFDATTLAIQDQGGEAFRVHSPPTHVAMPSTASSQQIVNVTMNAAPIPRVGCPVGGEHDSQSVSSTSPTTFKPHWFFEVTDNPFGRAARQDVEGNEAMRIPMHDFRAYDDRSSEVIEAAFQAFRRYRDEGRELARLLPLVTDAVLNGNQLNIHVCFHSDTQPVHFCQQMKRFVGDFDKLEARVQQVLDNIKQFAMERTGCVIRVSSEGALLPTEGGGGGGSSTLQLCVHTQVDVPSITYLIDFSAMVQVRQPDVTQYNFVPLRERAIRRMLVAESVEP